MAEFQPPEGLQPKIGDEIEQVILRGLIDRRVEVEGPDFDYADSHLIAYARSVRTALERAGFRLLPPGGEVETQWSVVFEDGFRSKTFDERLAHLWFGDPQAAIVRPIERRAVTTWPDGSKLTGPWSPVVSDNSEGESDAGD